jgi:hypothetical protein
MTRRLKCLLLIAIPVLIVRQLHAQPAKPDVQTIIERSSKVALADQKASANYDNSETDTKADGTMKTYSVQMLYGSPYQELIAVNGEPLSGEQQKQERRKLRNERARREQESPEEHVRRVAEFQAEEKRDSRFLGEFTKAFDFKMTGEEELDHHQVYVLEATPRRDYHPPDRETQALKGMRGKMWIDKETYQWVKVEAEVTHPVSIIGFVATVEPGTRFELEKMPVDGEIWLPKHFAMTARAKILEVFHHKGQDEETYFNYHKGVEPSGSSR